MRPHSVRLWLTTLSLTMCLAMTLSDLRPAMNQEQSRPVPKASCESEDRTESVQGETTLAERFVSGKAKAYNCNLELVGQFEGEGAATSMEGLDNCAYFSTALNPQVRRRGVAVLDVSDSRQPRVSTYLDRFVMQLVTESLAIDRTHKILLGSRPPDTFETYDLSADCRHPVLISSTSLPGIFAHVGQFASDGRTYYGAKWPPDPKAPPASAVFALDMSHPSHPRVLATWVPLNETWITHAVSINNEGTRAYVALKRIDDDAAKAANPNGLVILDVSDIQTRRSNPQFRVLSELFWDDSHEAEQLTAPVVIQGRPYLIFADGVGAVGIQSPPPAGVCDSRRPGHGFARIIDISDEKHPTTVSKLMLESAEPANCSNVMHDPTLFGGYGSFACSADHNEDGKLLACAYFEGGLRIFDIRDPLHPAEVAYYKPPARRTESRPGSLFFEPSDAKTLPQDHTADSTISVPIFRKNSQEIWFASTDNGFQVVRFSARFIAAHPDPFPQLESKK
jgi:hypothetical protein